MKTLVVYASKKGYAKECARHVADGIGSDSIAVQVGREANTANIDNYEAVIVGGSIHMGNLSGSLKSWLANHAQELLEKPLGLFVCGLGEEEQEQYFTKNFPSELLEHAKIKCYLGASLILKQYNPIIRAMMKKITKKDEDIHMERPEAVKACADAFK